MAKRKKRDFEKILPLELTRQLSREYPTAWEDIENYREHHKDEFPESVYVDQSYAFVVAQRGISDEQLKKLPEPFISTIIGKAYMIQAAASWRIAKQVYNFDPDLEQTLCAQDELEKLPTEILRDLPYPCIYIKTSTVAFEGRTIDGFFVCMNYDKGTKAQILNILVMYDLQFIRPISLNLSKETIDESIQEMIQMTIDTKNEFEILKKTDISSSYSKSFKKLYCDLIHLTLYLLASNRDVERKTSAKATKTISATNTTEDVDAATSPVKNIKDKYKEINSWDVGVRIGKAIRRAKNDTESDSSSEDVKVRKVQKTATGHSKRPHMRRAHWHHFWTGKRSDVSSRKIVLKWVPPTYVNANSEEETPVVVHDVLS